jgi:hypothetical protein
MQTGRPCGATFLLRAAYPGLPLAALALPRAIRGRPFGVAVTPLSVVPQSWDSCYFFSFFIFANCASIDFLRCTTAVRSRFT